MRKQEKKELNQAMKGLRLTQCKVHNLPLVRHEHDFFGDGTDVEECWDCPGLEPDGSPCKHHVHGDKVHKGE